MVRWLVGWLDRHLFLAVVLLVMAYFAWGALGPNFSRGSQARRGDIIDRQGGDITVGCLWNSHGKVELYPPSSFLLGARLAVREVNSQPIEGKGYGLLLPGPGGTMMARRLKLIERGSGAETTWRTGSDAAANFLALDRDLVGVVNNLADPAAQQAAVVFESAGVINLASGGPSLGMSAPLLSTITLVPEFNVRAGFLTRVVPAAISASLQKPVRSIGILFKESPPYNEISVQMMLKERSVANQIAKIILTLQRLVARGDISEDTRVTDVVKRYRMLLSPAQVSEMKKIVARLSDNPRLRTLTLREIFTDYIPQQMVIDVPFVQSYSPFTTNFRDYLASFQASGADALYILDDPVAAIHIIRQFREMGIKTPVVLPELADADRIVTELAAYSDDIFSGSVYDPTASNPRMDAFRADFKRFMSESGLPPNEPDGQVMRGYESIWLLAECISRTRSAVPKVLAGAFEYSLRPWEGKLGTVYSFDNVGQVQNRPLTPVRLFHGRLMRVEVKEAVLVK